MAAAEGQDKGGDDSKKQGTR